MNSFYSSDEDIAWGQVTPNEIKRHMKSQVRKKPQKRHSVSNISHNSKETSGTSILKDIRNESNIFITNDSFKSGTKLNSNIALLAIHAQLTINNFPATTGNNNVLSEDSDYDVSVPSIKNEYLITGDSSEQNFKASKHKGLSNDQGNISDYYEKNSPPPDDDPDRNRDDSIYESEGSQQIPESCQYILGHKMESRAWQDGQSGNEIQLMPQFDYESAGTGMSVNSDVVHCQNHLDDSKNTQKSSNISRNSFCHFVSEEDIDEKVNDRDFQIILRHKGSVKNSKHCITLRKEVSLQFQDSSKNKKDSAVYLDRQSVNEIELTHYDGSVVDEPHRPKCNYSSEQCDVLENIQNNLNVMKHCLSKINCDMDIILKDALQSNSTPQKNIKVNIVEDNHDYFQNHKSARSDASYMSENNVRSNREELNKTPEMVERKLSDNMKIHDKPVDKQNNTKSTSLSASKDKKRIPKLLKSPHFGDTSKVSQNSQKQKLMTPRSKSASKYKFNDVVSPVGMFIKYSPKPVLKQNNNTIQFKSPAILKKIATSPQISKPTRSINQDLPAAIYKHSKKQVTSSAKKLFLPPSLERMVPKFSTVKHEGQRYCPHNESDIDRQLLTESELTRYSISDSSILDNTSQDVSVLTIKNTFK